jgi:hypothetical protein
MSKFSTSDSPNWCGTCSPNKNDPQISPIQGELTISYAFYGCCLGNLDNDISNKIPPENLLVTSKGVFLIVPRKMKRIRASIDQDDLNNGHVKMSQIANCFGIKKTDITPDEDELKILYSAINTLVVENEKKEMIENVGYYFIDLLSLPATYLVGNFMTDLKLVNILPINMKQ